MPDKYNIPIVVTPPRFRPIGKYATVSRPEDCAGSCRECVRTRCIYGIFKENDLHVSAMDEPEYLYICQSCLRCVQECTKGIFSMSVNPEYNTLGDDYWHAEIITETWNQAHNGKIPVSGAGYRGPFVGKGFDSMWTDMSEIVRPTRDGIHGREYINTGVELSRRPERLVFADDMSLVTSMPKILELPIPILFQQPDFGILSKNVLESMAAAAAELGTMMLVEAESYSDNLLRYASSLVPCLTLENYNNYTEIISKSRMVEMAYRPGIEAEFGKLRSIQPDLVISVGIPLTYDAAEQALGLAGTGVDTIHFYADSRGNELAASEPRFLKEMIREVHLKLVDHRVRNGINLIFSGGIAMAEHMAKAIICGADAIAIDYPLLIALECRLCRRCIDEKSCPVKLEEVEVPWGCQRIINLIGAWRNQLIEVMGAMGIREVRRLRGEVGRSMWFEDLERDSFGPIFGERKVSGII